MEPSQERPPSPTSYPASAAPPHQPAPGALPVEPRSFRNFKLFVFPPIFFGAFFWVFGGALGGPGIVILPLFAAFFALIAARILFREPYVVRVAANGTVTFKAFGGTTTTNLWQITRIQSRRAGRGGVSYGFFFPGGTASVSGMVGKQLARYLASSNPNIDAPGGWLGVR